MQGRIPWISLVVLLGTAPAWAAETIRPVSVTVPASVVTETSRPANAIAPDTSAPREQSSILSLPSLATIQAVVNGRRLVPAAR
jgi:hypothetical protein